MGYALYELKRYEDALLTLDTAMDLEPRPETELLRGQTLSAMGKHREALISFEKVLKENRGDVDAWYAKGYALYHLGHHEQELESWQQVLKLDPNNSLALYNVAYCYARKGEGRVALDFLRRALSEKPEELRAKAKTDSDFDRIRDDPEFRKLVYQEDKSSLH